MDGGAKGKPDAEAREARRQASAVLRHLLGERPQRVTALGGGLTNHVFAARCGGDDLIVRINPDPSKLKDYLKEQWAIGRAREQGVPAPEVLEVGTEPIGRPYMVARKVAGEPATWHPARCAILREVGRLARLIHSVPTVGYGGTFDWSDNRLSKKDSWRDYLKREFHGEERLGTLERHGMLPPASVKALRRALRAMGGWRPEPALNHGDLRLKNVVVDEGGAVQALLDWEFCTSHVAPHWDLSLALHDLSIDEKEAFLDGYGMGADALLEAAPAMRVFNALNYAAAVEEAAAAKDARRLDRLRARLRGGLDLYAF